MKESDYGQVAKLKEQLEQINAEIGNIE